MKHKNAIEWASLAVVVVAALYVVSYCESGVDAKVARRRANAQATNRINALSNALTVINRETAGSTNTNLLQAASLMRDVIKVAMTNNPVPSQQHR